MGRVFLLGVFWIVGLTIHGQQSFSGRVIDLHTGQPVAQAEIRIKGSETAILSDPLGEFIFGTGDSLSEGEILIKGQTVYWNLPTSGVLSICNTAGQIVLTHSMNIGEGETALGNLSDGIYILWALLSNGKSFHTKFFYHRDGVEGNTTLHAVGPVSPHPLITHDTITISKAGYYVQEHAVNLSYAEYELMLIATPASTDYLSKLIRLESFKLLEGPPLNPVFSEINSIKVIYSIADDKIYYTNSTKYFIHYEFARDILNYKKGHAVFNQEQYTNNPNRLYILATLNQFTSSGIYTLDFFAGDELDCSQIARVYQKVVQTTFIGTKLRFYANNLQWLNCTSVPSITSDELFAGQNYQPLNPGEAYGYLKKFTLPDLETGYAGRHDIALLNGIPLDIAVVAGIITTEFQTPLSHINVLSHNRGAPNMALRDGWTNPGLEALANKLVYLNVTLDTFIVREASLVDAQTFWAIREPAEVTRLRCDTVTQGIFNLAQATIESDTVIGGKAANFSELLNVIVSGYGPLPLPEGAFAIPFYYYWQHMHAHSLDVYVREMIREPRFLTDYQYRKSRLLRLQDTIASFPVDPALLALVNSKISESGGQTNVRFRSSTNSEDIKGFNGAGLYDSYTGIPGDPDKTIEKAIKKVWASLWNLAAFEEREYFKIDQQSVAMAVLVHRSFPDEAANGVVITENLYNQFNPGFTINAQVGEISITNPEGGYTPDQVIWYSFDDIIEYISHSNVPGMQGKTVLSNAEIQELADYCLAIHNHYCRLNAGCLPVDIEFKVDRVNGRRKIYIKQARLY